MTTTEGKVEINHLIKKTLNHHSAQIFKTLDQQSYKLFRTFINFRLTLMRKLNTELFKACGFKL